MGIALRWAFERSVRSLSFLPGFKNSRGWESVQNIARSLGDLLATVSELDIDVRIGEIMWSISYDFQHPQTERVQIPYFLRLETLLLEENNLR